MIAFINIFLGEGQRNLNYLVKMDKVYSNFLSDSEIIHER